MSENISKVTINPVDFPDSSYLLDCSKEDVLKHIKPSKTSIEPSEIMYSSEDQTILPYYTLNHKNSIINFNEASVESEQFVIESLKYHRLKSNFSPNRRIPNNINYIMDYLFKYWNILGYDKLFNFSFVKDGVSKDLYVGPGILLNSEEEILFCLGFRKEILNKLNSIRGIKKFADFYKAIRSQEIQSAQIFNENGVLLFSTDFVQKPEYSRFYKALLSGLVAGTKYNMDMLVTEDIEKYLYNLSSNTSHSVSSQFKTSAERNEFFKRITQKSITDI